MIYINDIPSFRNPESEVWIINDRLERIELIGSVIVQDNGRTVSGDIIQLKCLFSKENYYRVEQLWMSRTPVNYTDAAGDVWQDMTLKVTEIERDRNFPEYVFVTFELWRAKIWQANA